MNFYHVVVIFVSYAEVFYIHFISYALDVCLSHFIKDYRYCLPGFNFDVNTDVFLHLQVPVSGIELWEGVG